MKVIATRVVTYELDIDTRDINRAEVLARRALYRVLDGSEPVTGADAPAFEHTEILFPEAKGISSDGK